MTTGLNLTADYADNTDRKIESFWQENIRDVRVIRGSTLRFSLYSDTNPRFRERIRIFANKNLLQQHLENRFTQMRKTPNLTKRLL